MKNSTRSMRLPALLLILMLVAAACGDDGAGDGMHAETGHEHGMTEWDGDGVPTVDLQVIEDPKAGWNVIASVDGYVFAPRSASTDHVAGEGHAHIEVDGAKVARVYDLAYHIKSLEPGTHEITYTLSTNDHNTYTIDGEPVQGSATIEVGEMTAMAGHDHHMVREWDGDATPTVDIEVVKDPKSGWNLFGQVDGFVASPEAASTDHVPGQGHYHIYINGERLARVYTHNFHISSLPAGDVTVELLMSANDHAEYTLDGSPLGGSAAITVSEEEAGGMAMGGDDEDGHMHGEDGHDGSGRAEYAVDDDVAADHVITVTVDGKIIDAEDRYSVNVGDVVEIRVTTDAHDDVHVHGYDIIGTAMPGTDAVLRFRADVPGIFEVEFEQAGTMLFELEVS